MKTCANCNHQGPRKTFQYSCTCIRETINGPTKKHGMFYFCSLRCLGQHHESTSYDGKAKS